ncbi:hypothetical protein CLV58_101191 [Spirosoma oryzae]|uniref:Uncharacterized protein n=1 Tax=Spirosoma oryzae TaxID=1469603 RepID=A0A2T0TN71_9BACT|nr:hypothetical protein [Spirosoma oryzae]PRY47125.1 hypothetical protein CLV58_101191 [Spirosoma oryzae]
MHNQNDLSLLERFSAPTPKLFSLIRNAGVILGLFSAFLMGLEAQGIELPAFLKTVAETSSLIEGIVAAVIAQLTVDFKALAQKKALDSI